jgi:hypothetical protein
LLVVVVVVVLVKVMVVVLAVVAVVVVFAGADLGTVAFFFWGVRVQKSNNLNSSKPEGLKLAGPQEREHPW